MRSTRSLFTLVALLAIVAGACTPAAAKPGWTYSPGGGGAPAASPGASGGTVGNGEIAGTLDLDAVDIAFKPSQLEVDAAGRYKVNLHNTGAIAHDITFPDGTAATAQPGETATVEVDVPAAGISFICSVPGHAKESHRCRC